MADLRDFTGKNRNFTGVSGITVSSGANTANRVDQSGRLRFNTTTNLLEYYTGTEWKSVDAPPTISTVSVDGGTAAAQIAIDASQSGNASIVITGSLFDTSAAEVLLIATSGSNISPTTTVRTNANSITITVPYSSFINANEPYDVRVTNPSGLFVTLIGAIVADTLPTFTNAVDTTFSIFDSTKASVNIPAASLVGATDAEGDTITYTVTTGTLPAGLTLNTETGVITGATTEVASDTTSTFTITASQSGGGASRTRQFKITQKAPSVTTFNSSGTFSVPAGVTTVDVLVVAGGGASSERHAGGGGAGGLIFRPGFTVTPGSSIPVTVGAGGPTEARGLDSVFSNLTAKGGGASSPGGTPGVSPGGSSAGSTHSPSNYISTATQPGQPGDSGAYGFGTAGGAGFYTSPPTGAQGGGGGGAGGAGGNSGPNNSGTGGAGKAYSISGSPVFYAGGGCGGGHTNAGPASGGIGGGGSRPGSGPGSPGQPGTANRGGGGGGGNDSNIYPTGGSGVVIVKF
jgi:hypothetical protein